MESFCEGKKLRKESINEDLESLFERIRLRKQPEVEEVRTYFVSKLAEELELVERKDPNYLGTFSWTNQNNNPDVDRIEMNTQIRNLKLIYCREN